MSQLKEERCVDPGGRRAGGEDRGRSTLIGAGETSKTTGTNPELPVCV